MAVSAKRTPHNWTDDQRTVLHLLHTDFGFDHAVRTRIFNIIFRDEIRLSGNKHGLGEISLESQYRDRTRPDRSHLWTSALRVPQTDEEEDKRQALVKSIHDAAASVGISTESASEVDEASGEQEEAEGVKGGNEEKTKLDDLSEQSLEMLHYGDLIWTENLPSIDSITDILIDHKSPVYQHGGQVHRLTITSNNTHADFMVCDTAICTKCSDSADPTLQSQTNGLPFVHSSCTTIAEQRTYFQPKPRLHSSDRPKHFRRLVQFEGTNGDFKCWVRICGNIGCQVCMWGNLLRNPALAKRQGLEEHVVGRLDNESGARQEEEEDLVEEDIV